MRSLTVCCVLLLAASCGSLAKLQPNGYEFWAGYSEGEDDFSHPRHFRSTSDGQIVGFTLVWSPGILAALERAALESVRTRKAIEAGLEDVSDEVEKNTLVALGHDDVQVNVATPEPDPDDDLEARWWDRVLRMPTTVEEGFLFALWVGVLLFAVYCLLRWGFKVPFLKRADHGPKEKGHP